MYTKEFAKIRKSDSFMAGGKGASLGKMTQARIPVPPGFVILATAFDKFILEGSIATIIGSTLRKVDSRQTKSVVVASKEIRQVIRRTKIPSEIQKAIQQQVSKLGAHFLAVRSSATAEDGVDASWAGELESYLNVTPQNVMAAVRNCWSSLFTPRAIFYRFEKKFQKRKVSVAVVVQTMIQSEVSGVAFTVHPVTKNRNHVVIEAGYGLGEAIVGGKITPDMFVVHKKSGNIIERRISEQHMQIVRSGTGTKETKVPRQKIGLQKLSDAVVLRLAKLCLTIEQHYKKPQDIEWAFAKGKLCIVQSRPITTL
ncbi:MAG: PEP/pyruvate-binding domain-containing protein [Patescibacteria group bacterium]